MVSSLVGVSNRFYRTLAAGCEEDRPPGNAFEATGGCRARRVGSGRGDLYLRRAALDVSRPEDRSHFQEDLCIHIFTVSAAMVGVCLTVIGLLRVTISIRRADTVADDLVAMDAVLFLLSCLSSYWALRTRSTRRLHRLERFADRIFILALLVMVGICGFIALVMTVSPT
jgi:hypothetical protein